MAQRSRADLNRCASFCRALPNHSATRPAFVIFHSPPFTLHSSLSTPHSPLSTPRPSPLVFHFPASSPLPSPLCSPSPLSSPLCSPSPLSSPLCSLYFRSPSPLSSPPVFALLSFALPFVLASCVRPTFSLMRVFVFFPLLERESL